MILWLHEQQWISAPAPLSASSSLCSTAFFSSSSSSCFSSSQLDIPATVFHSFCFLPPACPLLFAFSKLCFYRGDTNCWVHSRAGWNHLEMSLFVTGQSLIYSHRGQLCSTPAANYMQYRRQMKQEKKIYNLHSNSSSNLDSAVNPLKNNNNRTKQKTTTTTNHKT